MRELKETYPKPLRKRLTQIVPNLAPSVEELAFLVLAGSVPLRPRIGTAFLCIHSLLLRPTLRLPRPGISGVILLAILRENAPAHAGPHDARQWLRETPHWAVVF